jgi:hypothetical protein
MPNRLKTWFKEWFIGHSLWSIFKMDRWVDALMAGVVTIATVVWGRIKGLAGPEIFVIALVVFVLVLFAANQIRRFRRKDLDAARAAADTPMITAHEPLSRLQLGEYTHHRIGPGIGNQAYCVALHNVENTALSRNSTGPAF